MPAKTWNLSENNKNLAVDKLITARDLGGEGKWSIEQVTLRDGLSDGVQKVGVHNGKMFVEILPTRGMGIWKATIGGDTIGWKSPVRGPVHPKFVDLGEPSGLGWLDGFDELFCRCGLVSNGAPEFDKETKALKYPVHGRIANRPAHAVSVTVDTDKQEISVTGVVEETRFHFTKLRMTTTITTKFNSSSFTVHDEILNFSAGPQEIQMLYHVNFGLPLLDAGSRVVVPAKTVIPRNARAASGVKNWDSYAAPEPAWEEMVYFLELNADAAGQTRSLLKNAHGTKGVSLVFNKKQLPWFSLWKNTTAEADGYVTGLEPGTNFPNPRSYEGEQGRVVKLAPGGKQVFEVTMEIHTTDAEVKTAENAVAKIQGGQEPKIFTEPQPGWCAHRTMVTVSDASPSPPKNKGTQPRFSFFRFRLRTLMLLVTLCCFGVWSKLQYDWYRKLSLAAKWVEPLVNQPPRHEDMPSESEPWGVLYSKLPPPPPKISAKEEFELLELAILRLSSPKQRMSGLKILVETRKAEVFPILRNLLAKSTHSEIKAALIHLICLERNAADVPELAGRLDHPDAEVRAAAADALGYIHSPDYLFSPEYFWREQQQDWLDVEPPIKIGPLLASEKGQKREAISLDPQVRLRLEQMMLTGATDLERSAAATVLVRWPPVGCHFRYAKWGVWLDDNGDLKLVQSVLDEIPPFVHQTANPLSSFQNRVNRFMFIDKPVVHLTTSLPLAVDLEVQIRQGRPWYAYPRPDDFTLETATRYGRFRRIQDGTYDHERDLKHFDRKNLGTLTHLSEGYSWRLPRHRQVGGHSGGMGAVDNVITSTGLRWQSLIVTPRRESWMVPPKVSDSPKFAWWKGLRDVPSSWVSSHGETERFVYYDGPSFANSPVTTCCDGHQLTLLTQAMIEWEKHIHVERNGSEQTYSGSGQTQSVRTGLLLNVRSDGIATKEFLISDSSDQPAVIDLPEGPFVTAQSAVKQLQALLIKAGLTSEEAGGLIVSWRTQFFETPGKRLLTILSREDYDEVCPLTIRPTPTQTVRVGIVLSELAE